MATPARQMRQLYKSLGLEQTKKSLVDKAKRQAYNRESFLNIASQMFQYDGLPDTMPAHALERLLQTCGGITVWLVPSTHRPNGFGPEFVWDCADSSNPCGPALYAFPLEFASGPDPYGFPYKVTVTSAGFTPTISECLTVRQDCIVMRNDNNMIGLYELCDYYASMLTEAEISLFSTLVTLRDHLTFVCKTQSQRDAVEAYLAALQAGDFAAVFAADLGTPMTVVPNTGRDNAVELAVNGIQAVRYMFYNAIGINPMATTKREYTSAQEIVENKSIILPQIDDMLYWREKGVAQINSKYGTNITVRKASAWELVQKDNELAVQMAEAEVDAVEQSNRLDEKESDENAAAESAIASDSDT